MHSRLLALSRLLPYLVINLALIPIQFVALKLDIRLSRRLPLTYHRLVARILLGIRIDLRGQMSSRRPTLFVSNHSSYMDIEILGSLIEGSFVAKAEVADWPFFGLLAKLQRTVFVQREAKHVRTQKDVLTERLESGENLILFAEGTSNDGNRTLPFKSSLFAVAAFRHQDGTPLVVQPVSIAYTHLDGIPLGRHLRPFFAWYGDMDLVPHLWHLVGLGKLTVRVHFHDPVTIDEFSSRKAIADYCHRVVADGMTAALYGRPISPAPFKEAA